MSKFTWEHNEDAELWQHDICETIEDCIKDAVENYDKEIGDIIYVGEPVDFTINVDSDRVLENLEEDAFDFAGEAAESWEPLIEAKRENLDELSEQLSKVVEEWLVKHGMNPTFYQIANVRAVEIK